jgi:hypothetical protein
MSMAVRDKRDKIKSNFSVNICQVITFMSEVVEAEPPVQRSRHHLQNLFRAQVSWSTTAVAIRPL